MFKIFKKAQTATEYLIILAVVIIIALIVVGVMGGIPGIGRSTGSRTSSAFWASQDVGITAYSVDAGRDVVLEVKNNNRNAVTLTEIYLESSTVDLVTSDVTIPAGGTTSVSGTATSLTACTAGQAYAYNVSMSYTDSKTNAQYTITGDGTTLDGTCAN